MKITDLFAIAAIAVSTDVSANLVVNGGFEEFTGNFAGDGGAQLIVSSTTLTGWSVGQGQEVAVLKTPNVYGLESSEGLNFIDLAGYSNTGFPKGLTQTITGLTVGSTYAFAMDLGIRNGPCVGGGNNCHGPVQASASIGSVTQTFTENSITDGNVWGRFGFDFVATSATLDLSIKGVSLPVGNAFIGLDNVTIEPTAVPLPPSMWMFGLAAVASLGLTRRMG